MIKIRRNDKCPCQSGKKYKKCCYLDFEKNAEILRASSIAGTYEEMVEVLNQAPKIYKLKVELLRMEVTEIEDEISRTYEILDKQTLYDLHLTIQTGFGWDNDHMFSFYLGEKLYDRSTQYSGNPLGEYTKTGYGNPSKSAAEYELRDLNLSRGFSFLYLFDYGAELVHKVTVKEIRELTESDEELSECKLVDEIGEAPSQYEWYEDCE